MEQVMWREGDLFRQRKEKEEADAGGPGSKGAVEGMSSTLETLALGSKQSSVHDAKRSKRFNDEGAAASESSTGADEAAEAEGKTTQGDLLRAMRARNGGGGGDGGVGMSTRRK